MSNGIILLIKDHVFHVSILETKERNRHEIVYQSRNVREDEAMKLRIQRSFYSSPSPRKVKMREIVKWEMIKRKEENWEICILNKY